MTTLHGAYPTWSPILILPANVSDLTLMLALGRSQLHHHQTSKADMSLSMPLSRLICCGTNSAPSRILSNVTVRLAQPSLSECCQHHSCLALLVYVLRCVLIVCCVVGIASHVPSLSEAEEARALQYRCECLESAFRQQSKPLTQLCVI